MNKIIVFGGGHYNTLGLIRSLGKKKLSVICLLHTQNKRDCSLRFSKYITKLHCVTTPEEGVELLCREYWNEEKKPILLFASDAAVLAIDSRYDEFKEKFFFFNAKGKISHYMDKINTFPIAKSSGINLIKTWQLTTNDVLPDNLVFPCLIKGNNSTESTKNDMFICNDEHELKNHLRNGVEYLVQEYIEKDYEVNIVGFSYNQGQDIVIPSIIHKIRDEMHRQSVYMRMDKLEDYPTLNIDSVKSFIKAIGYEGVFSVELLCKQGTYYFLEVNMRNDGCGYFYTAAGANYPWLWVQYCQGKDLTDEITKIKVKTPYYLISFDDFKNMLERKISFFRWIHDLFAANAYFVFDIKDPLPFCHSMLIHVRQGFKLIMRKLFRRKG